MNTKKLLVLIAAMLIVAPVATAGTPSKPIVSEKAAGLFQVPERSPIVSEKTAGLFEAQQPSPIVSEKTAGLWRTPAPVSFTSPVAASDGFDWNDAGVGAGITIASLLLASAGTLAIRRRGLPAH